MTGDLRIAYQSSNWRSLKHSRVVYCLLAILLIQVFAGCGEEVPQKSSVRGASTRSDCPTATQPVQGKRVLLVHSYHPEYPWVGAITRGVENALQGSDINLEIFYMDTKRKTDEQWRERAGELAVRKVDQFNPDVVIAVDDNAQQYFATKYVGSSLPIIFCGVNADPSKYGYPASNVTGIIERPHFNGTVEYINELLPVHRIAILSSDDPTSLAAHSFMKQEYHDFEVVEFRLEGEFDMWKNAVRELCNEVDALGIYMYHTIKADGSKESLDPAEVMKWTVDNATVPTLGFFDFGIEDGLMMGIVESGEEHGMKAAHYALEVLKGTPLSSLPTVKANVGIRMMNPSTAAKLGIELNAKVSSSTRFAGRTF